MNKFANQTVIVTGAGRGIGLAIARAFARENAQLVLCDVNRADLEQVGRDFRANHIRCTEVAGDISEMGTAERIVKAAVEAFSKIDVVVNNAGINYRSPFLELPVDVWQKMLDINLNGAFYLLKQALPVMADRGSGAIVNVSSSASKTPHANAAASYGVSKGGINALTRQLAYEMAKYHIRVNAVCPGPVETDMSLQWTQEYRKQVLQKIPLGRLGKPEDVANLVAFLASDEASFITGEVININGGTYMD